MRSESNGSVVHEPSRKCGSFFEQRRIHWHSRPIRPRISSNASCRTLSYGAQNRYQRLCFDHDFGFRSRYAASRRFSHFTKCNTDVRATARVSGWDSRFHAPLWKRTAEQSGSRTIPRAEPYFVSYYVGRPLKPKPLRKPREVIDCSGGLWPTTISSPKHRRRSQTVVTVCMHATRAILSAKSCFPDREPHFTCQIQNAV